MPISNITRTNTVDEWRIQTNLSANSLNKLETGNYDKTAGSLNIACTAVLSITSSGTGLSVANNALVSGDFTVGKSIALGSEGAATGNLSVGANTFIYGKGAALFVANSAIVNVSIQATQSIRTNNFIANTDASITGTAQIGYLTVNNSTAIGTTLAVTGNTTVGNLVTANSVVGDNGRFSSNLVASHFVTVSGSLVADSARITSNATFGETTATTINATNARISGNANVAHVTATGSLVADSARITANATFGETTATTINATNARISGNANVSHLTASASVVADNARITANTTGAHFVASGSFVADSARITANATFGETTATTINTTNARISGNANVSSVTASNSLVADNARITANTTGAHFVASGSLVADSARIAANATFGETTATTINATNARISGNANAAHVTIVGSVVADSARIAANATFGETTAITINATNARISGNANVAHVTATGSLVADSARITANATFGETTAITINATNARISGNANVAANITVSDSVVADSLRITNDAGIGGTLRVTGNSVFGNVNTANMMYAGSLRTVGRADVGGAFTVGGDASVGGKLTVSGDFVLSGDIVYDTDVLSISTVTPVTTTGAAYYGVFRGNTTGGVIGHNMAPSAVIVNGRSYRVSSLGSTTLVQWQARFSSLTGIPTVGQIIVATSSGNLVGGGLVTDRDSDANAYIRWAASSNTWQIRDVFNPDVGTSYSKILTANLISDSLTSTSTDTFLSSSGAKSLKDSINTEITDRSANVGAARIEALNATVTANTNLKNYVDSTYSVATNITSGTLGFARLPSIYLGTTAVQSTQVNQALTGITSLRGGVNTTDITIGSADTSSTTTPSGVAVFQSGDASGTNSGSGIVNLKTGNATGTGTSGSLSVYVGQSGTSACTTGTLTVLGGTANGTTSTGGEVSIRGGLTGVNATTSATGGDVRISGGRILTLPGTRRGGSIYLDGGDFVSNVSPSATSGNVFIGTNPVSGYLTNSVVLGASGTPVIINGTTRLPNLGTSGFVKLSAGGQLAQDTTDYSSAASLTSGTLPAARLPAFSGDISTSAGSSSTTLATVNTDVGSMGSATHVPRFTVNGKGLITSANSVAISIDAGTHISSGTLAAARLPAFSGDISTSAGSSSTTLATVNTTTGNIGGAATVPVFTVNGKGLVTYAANVAISIASSAVSGLATSATTDATNAGNISSGTLAAARLPAFSGDITTTAGSSSTTLATVNTNTGGWGSASSVPTFVVNAKGLITAAGNVAISIASSAVSGLASSATTNALNATNINEGTLAAARLPAFSGDITTTAGSSATTLATVNTTTGTFGGAATVPVFTVNGKGLVTYSGNVAISIASSAVSGLASSATTNALNATNINEGTLNAARLPAFSGDITTTAGSSATTLANSGVTAQSVGSATHVSRFTVDAKGRITSANSIAISIASSAVSGLASSATTDTTNATNISSGTLAAARLGTTGAPQFGSLGVGTAASGTTGEIRATGDITAGYSDDKLKTRLGNIENALEKVSSITGFYYEPNETAQDLGYALKKEVGVSAQEVQAILPEVVVPAPVDNRYLTVHYEKLIPLLIEAIKELKAEVDELKKK